MVTTQLYVQAKKMALEIFAKANIALSNAEQMSIEIADFGLGDLFHTGLQLVTYINTSRVCAKEMVLLPHQTCPEHIHPTMGTQTGKEETFRCRYGTVYLYIDGSPSEELHCSIPENFKEGYSVFHEIILTPGEQYTIIPLSIFLYIAEH